MKVYCPDCGTQAEMTPERWRCGCGGAWEPTHLPPFEPALIDENDCSIWRYRRLYGLRPSEPAFRMGAGWTPLLPLNVAGRRVWVKLEYLAPTGSFKDRGTELMMNVLAAQGVSRVAEDSSGNAGASVAAYAARGGMEAEIYVPAHASPAKLAQIRVYGAHVTPVPGPRANAKQAAIASVERGAVYASHAYHPAFLLGQMSVAYEVWEQLGRRAPDWYLAPVGQGVHLLGAWLGFRHLWQAGLIERVPRMVGVQAALLAPVSAALEAGLDHVPAVEPRGTSLAEGLAINPPVRGRRLLQAIRDSGGTCLTVTEEEIVEACAQMAGLGFYIEPSSAVVVAALKQLDALAGVDEDVVAPLTGSGLKGRPELHSARPAADPTGLRSAACPATPTI